MAFIICCLSIYWGVFTHIGQNLGVLHIAIVDFDGQVAPYDNLGVEPFVGPTISQLAQQMVATNPMALGYQNYDAAQFNGDPMEARRFVYDFKAWAAIIINSNATALLYSSIQNGNASYDPMGACQLVYNQARDNTNWASYIYPSLSTFLTEATTMVGQQWTQTVMQNATSNDALVQNALTAPQVLSPAIGFSRYNLRPFYPYFSTPAVSIGLIYLIIVSFFSFSFYLPIHFKVSPQRAHPSLYTVADHDAVPQTRRPSPLEILPTNPLALVRNNGCLLHALVGLLPHLPSLRHELSWLSRRPHRSR